MKRINLTLLSVLALVLFGACSDEKEAGPTPPAGPALPKVTYTIDFESEAFASKVATSPSTWEFMQEGYAWQEEQTTLSHSAVFTFDYGYALYGGGLTLSRYSTSDVERYGTYESDLYVYSAEKQSEGAEGDNTFLIAYGNYETEVDASLDMRPVLTFADGKPRTIRECWVNSTSYFVNVVENGNPFSPAIKDDEEIKIYATGYDAEGSEGTTVELSFACKGALIKEWTRWELSALGEVVTVKFNIKGGNTDDWGMTSPKYFAIDNIVVEQR